MRILIDIGHPAHVHYFRNFYKVMSEKGHHFLITARKKESSQELLKSYNIPYIDRGTGSNSSIGKLLYLTRANYFLLKNALSFKPDLFMSFSSPYAAQVSSILRKPHIALDDTEHARLGRILYRPFTEVVLSPNSYKGSISKKQKLFNGFLELLYLRPDYFTPNPQVLSNVDIEPGETFSFLRFVSWNANHDFGMKGISIENKRRVVKELSLFGKVLISSENELPPDLQTYQININPSEVHHILHYASLVFGESATMASESAVLGTPAIFIDNVGRGYTDELEKTYGLVYNFQESSEGQENAIRKAVEIMESAESSQQLYQQRRKQLLEETIDVNRFLSETVERVVNNYNQNP